MLLAGIPVDTEDLVWLADELSGRGYLETAGKLIYADARNAETVEFTTEELDVLASVLDNPPGRFGQLRQASPVGRLDCSLASSQSGSP